VSALRTTATLSQLFFFSSYKVTGIKNLHETLPFMSKDQHVEISTIHGKVLDQKVSLACKTQQAQHLCFYRYGTILSSPNCWVLKARTSKLLNPKKITTKFLKVLFFAHHLHKFFYSLGVRSRPRLCFTARCHDFFPPMPSEKHQHVESKYPSLCQRAPFPFFG